MTTPTAQSMQDQFNKDFDALMGGSGAADQYGAAVSGEVDAQTYYKDVVLKKVDSMQSADQILVYLQMYVFQNSLPPSDPHSDGSVLGIFGDQVGIQGLGLKVNSALTAVHNDLQKMVDSGDTVSNDPTVVANVASDLDRMLDAFKNNKLIQAMDPTSLTNMAADDTALRSDIFVYGDTSGYNPTPNDPKNPDAAGNSYHFIVGGPQNPDPNYLTTYTEMQADMKLPGDIDGATEAYQNATNNFNSNTSMTQTVNSALNEKINQITNFIKTVMGFWQNGLLQPAMKLDNVAIQNQTKGS